MMPPLLKKPKNQQEPDRYKGVGARIQLVAVAMTLVFSILVARLWWLQVVNGHFFEKYAQDQSVRTKRLGAERGAIYGRNGTLLADNRASTDIIFVPGRCKVVEMREEVCERLEELIGISAADLAARVEANRYAPFSQITVKQDVSKADIVRIEEFSYALPGVSTVVWPRRRYLYGETGGQIIGYLGLDPDAKKESLGQVHYLPSDYVGRSGLELTYEKLLHGEDGSMLVTEYAYGSPQFTTDRYGLPTVAQHDSHGNLLTEVSRIDPQSGGALHLTLDIDLQERCEDLLRGEVGSIVVLEAETGAVLALASHPGYDPNVFVDRVPGSVRTALLTDTERRPMLSRAYQDNYAPGSVFKFVMAAAGLEEGIIDENSTFYCPGRFQLNKTSWYCWRRAGHGHTAVVDALAYSCDVFFYNLGLELGHERIVEWAHRFGLGEETGIDLPAENPALMPTDAWKQRLLSEQPIYNRRWQLGDTVNLSIGQGYALTTPLQNAVMTAVVLNGGRRVRPYLNQELAPDVSEAFLSERTIELILQGAQKCVEKTTFPSGTGTEAKIEGMTVVGKTGTAQVAALAARKPYTDQDLPVPRKLLHHAWFVTGVLDREPRIAVCVLVEHGESGGHASAPLAKEVIEYFYERTSADTSRLASAEVAP